MSRLLRRTLLALALLLTAAALFVWHGLRSRPDIAAWQHLTLPATTAEPGQLRMRFAGVSTLVFDDGETVWMTDGFFSRPSRAGMLGRIAPDEERVDAELRALGVARLAAIVPLHAHYDHALDAPLIARKTGAQLVGGASVLNLGRGAGLPAAQLRAVKSGDVLRLGRFTLTFIASRHAPTFWSDGSGNEPIEAPLAPPALASAWREGEVWSLLVEHDGRRVLVQASAGFVPGALKTALAGRRVETVFLGTAALGRKTPDYRDAYWREVVQAADARRVVPIHWDDFWLPLPAAGTGAQGQVLPAAMPDLLDDVAAGFADVQRRSAAEHRELRLPPLRLPFDPYAPPP